MYIIQFENSLNVLKFDYHCVWDVEWNTHSMIHVWKAEDAMMHVWKAEGNTTRLSCPASCRDDKETLELFCKLGLSLSQTLN